MTRPIRTIGSSEAPLAFPSAGYVGVPARIAELYAHEHEAAKEFVYMDMLTLIGTALSGRLEVDFGDLNTQPRIYALKIAKSGWSRKSTATRFSEKVISKAIERSYGDSLERLADNAPSPLQVIYGVGSAEGLIGRFRHVGDDSGWVGDPRIVVSWDEFRRFEKKVRGESSVLLYATNELYDRNSYDNSTKGQPLSVRNAHLGLIANTTDETYQGLLDAGELEDVGFLNRLFLVVSGETRRRIARPRSIQEELDPLITELGELFKGLPPVGDDGKCEGPTRLQLTEEAERIWTDWYVTLPETKTTTRLDAMGPRLMGIVAFVSGKREVDAENVRTVIALLEYQRRVREVFQPIVGDSSEARLEARMLQQHRQRGPLSRNECRRFVNGDRVGSRMFDKVYEQFRVRYLQPSTNGSRCEKFELKSEYASAEASST
jgi:hypothetical protein